MGSVGAVTHLELITSGGQRLGNQSGSGLSADSDRVCAAKPDVVLAAKTR
jgi:hypothetical protein